MTSDDAPPAKRVKPNDPSTSKQPVQKAKTTPSSIIDLSKEPAKTKVVPVPNLTQPKTTLKPLQSVIEKPNEVAIDQEKSAQKSVIEKGTIKDQTPGSSQDSKIQSKKEDKPAQSVLNPRPVKAATGKKQPYRLAKKELEKTSDELYADLKAFHELPEEEKTPIGKKIAALKGQKYWQRQYENRVEITRKGLSFLIAVFYL